MIVSQIGLDKDSQTLSLTLRSTCLACDCHAKPRLLCLDIPVLDFVCYFDSQLCLALKYIVCRSRELLPVFDHKLCPLVWHLCLNTIHLHTHQDLPSVPDSTSIKLEVYYLVNSRTKCNATRQVGLDNYRKVRKSLAKCKSLLKI